MTIQAVPEPAGGDTVITTAVAAFFLVAGVAGFRNR